jgi:hypothetical protein
MTRKGPREIQSENHRERERERYTRAWNWDMLRRESEVESLSERKRRDPEKEFGQGPKEEQFNRN